MCEFEEKVKIKLEEILQINVESKKRDSLRIGVAVSGGADSISLLLALSHICKEYNPEIPLYVITVNHNIRPAAESRGDVDFVLDVCEKLRSDAACGAGPVCEVVELEPGAVEQEALRRDGGIEEAARYLRYEEFSRFVQAHGLNALCTAHTQNDQLETLLMRFLQGSPVDGAGGIKPKRILSGLAENAVYARPLLGITRDEIESYLKNQGFTWCTDKTNLETEYLRNKIRLKLVPFLDENFPGWQKAVLSGAEKASEDAELIGACLEKVPVRENADCVEIPADIFLKSPSAIQRRVFLSACNKAGERTRIPNSFIKDLLSSLNNTEKDCKAGAFTKRYAGIDIIYKKNTLFVKKHSESNTDFVFSDIIEDTGTFEFPFGNLLVYNYRVQNEKKLVSVCAGNLNRLKGESIEFSETDKAMESGIAENVTLPFCVRNSRIGDSVLCSDGSSKKVSDIFSDWHVAPDKKSLIPVIQLLDEKSQGIKAIFGGFLGYKDWIIKV